MYGVMIGTTFLVLPYIDWHAFQLYIFPNTNLKVTCFVQETSQPSLLTALNFLPTLDTSPLYSLRSSWRQLMTPKWLNGKPTSTLKCSLET